MYPFRDKATGLFGFAVGDEWVVAPSFYYANVFRHKRALVEKPGEKYWFLEQNLDMTSVSSIGHRIIPNSTIHEVVPVDERSSESIACCLILERGREQSFVAVDLNLVPTLLHTTRFNPLNRLYADSGWIVLRIGGREESRTYAFNSRNLQKLVLPEYDEFYASLDGHWVVTRDSDNSANQSFAFFSIDELGQIGNWFSAAFPFSEGFGLAVNSKNQFVFVNHEIKTADGMVFDNAGRFSFGLAAGERGTDSGYFWKNGVLAFQVEPGYDKQRFDRLGRAVIVSEDQQYRSSLIDRQGEMLLSDCTSIDFFDGDFPYYRVSCDWHEPSDAMLLNADLEFAVRLT